jgi:ABC-type Fe3+-siderophore transport system permease subunit
LAGFGIATLAVIYSSLPLGSLTPIVALVLGIAAGIVIAGLARRGGNDKDEPAPA